MPEPENLLLVYGNSLRTADSALIFPTPPCGLSEAAGHIAFHSPSLDQKSLPVMEMKVTSGRVGKEDRRGAAQEKKQLGIKDREDKKAKLPGKEAC